MKEITLILLVAVCSMLISASLAHFLDQIRAEEYAAFVERVENGEGFR